MNSKSCSDLLLVCRALAFMHLLGSIYACLICITSGQVILGLYNESVQLLKSFAKACIPSWVDTITGLLSSWLFQLPYHARGDI